MQCRNCGATLEPEARFCQDCGTPVDGQPARQDAQPARGGYKPAQVKTGKRVSSRNIAIGIICISLIIGVGICAAALLGLNGPASQSAASSSSQAAEESASSSSAESEASSSASASSEASEKSASSSAAEKKKEEKVFDAVKAEEKARKDAQAAGMQVFTGTVHMTTFGQRANEVNPKLSSGIAIIADYELALFTFGVQENVSGLSSGGYGEIETRLNQDSLSLGNPWQWREFDDQLITIAAYPEDIMFPNNIAGYLYSAAGNAEIIAPLDEQGYANLEFYRQGLPEPLPDLPTSIPSSPDKKSSSSSEKSSSSEEKSSEAATPSDGSYILPESSTRTYSRSELEKLSDYELFIARNEIYARHGRKFQSEELQSYFEGKSWYKGTTEGSAFDEGVLNDTETANATLIREVETAHNSKYL
ncbi:MAG: YARHG domain-containing protein [Eggerthellaceae bacterium]|nr:YARHG domain-containing protein [Eggerthellaceae bacterium]